MSALSSTKATGQRNPSSSVGVLLRLATVGLAGLADLTMTAGPAEAEAVLKASAGGSQRDEQVNKFCQATVIAAFQAARKVQPPGLGTFACSCFLDQVNLGAGLDVAQNTCRQRTMARYSL